MSSRRDEASSRSEPLRGAAVILREEQWDIVHTREVGLAQADDASILDWCRAEERTLITLDADFHALLTLSGATAPSVVRIRIEGLLDVELAKLIEKVIHDACEDLRRGCAVTVTPKSVRLHHLPLGSNVRED